MLWWFAQTTLIAGALAIVATLAGRRKRLGPEVRHALWLVVLVKLAIPPLVAWPWSLPDAWPARVASDAPPVVEVIPPRFEPVPEDLPAPPVESPQVAMIPSLEEGSASVEVPVEARRPVLGEPGPLETHSEVLDPSLVPPTVRPEVELPRSPIWDLDKALLALWLAGSVVVVARRAWKVYRFHQSLEGSRLAPGWLIEEARTIGDRVGVRPPPLLATNRVVTPLLWCLGRPRLILPEALIKRLGVDRWPGILAHELAHLARGDHWVVRLELLVEAIWWWNPLFWLARRRLHEEAEMACDARVVRSLPERRHAYAEALVDVCEHIARSKIPSPALGVGGRGSAHFLEGRLDMILREPVPGRPTRRGVLLAVLLAALGLPAWTLGQQQPETPKAVPEAPPSKPEAPKPETGAPAVPVPLPPGTTPSKPTSPPDAPPEAPSAPAPAPPAPAATSPAPRPQEPASLPSIQAILAARKEARQKAGFLSFRYIVAGRDQSHFVIYDYGNRGPLGGLPKGAGGAKIRHRKDILVQVADVTLSAYGGSRLDVLEARPAALPDPGQPRPPGWDRRFVAKNDLGYLTLEATSDESGPVPFRWLGMNSRQGAFGDSLCSVLYGGANYSVDPDKGIDPLDPRPANMLDLYLGGAGNPFLNSNTTHAEVVGLDTIDGREVVRVAWMANADIGLRGLSWLAPSLAYAEVRSDATMDPSRPGFSPVHGRRSWRMRSSDFVPVGHLWLPRKVTREETEADPAGGDSVRRVERDMTFEDFRAAPTLPVETFHPKLAVQAIDDLSGNFTAKPPEIPPGLVDRLAQAVRDSKFGPPIVENWIVEPKPLEAPPAASGKPGDGSKPGGGTTPNSPQGSKPGAKPAPANAGTNRAYADIVANVDEAPTGRLMSKDGLAVPLDPASPKAGMPKPAINPTKPGDDAAKADPGIIARPAAGFADPIPIVQPKADEPLAAKVPDDRSELERAVERRFRLEPQVAALQSELKKARTKIDQAQRIASQPQDPAVVNAKRKLDSLTALYIALWEAKSGGLREEIAPILTRDRDEIEVLQARRAGKAAEMQKASALRDLARVAEQRNVALKKKGPNYVSNEEFARAEAELAVAEAELASKKAGLDEADAYVNQTKRRFDFATASGPTPDLLADKAVPPTPAENPKAAEREPGAQEGRDEVAIRQASRDGKAAELQKVEGRLAEARKEWERASRLMVDPPVGRQEREKIETNLKLAEADVVASKAELAEADVFLNQARRQPGSRSSTPLTTPGTPARESSQADLRDAIEVLEVQLQGKRAELRGEDLKLDRLKTHLDDMKKAGLELQDSYRDAKADIEEARAGCEVKKAEVLEYEIRLKQARRRLDANEPQPRPDASKAQLLNDIERAKDRLKWSEEMFKKGFVSKATTIADRLTYDSCVKQMIQLDPTYVPERPPSAVPE